MKKILCMALLLTGCLGHQMDISGTYANHAIISGASVYDTLQLRQINGEAWEVTRRRRVQKEDTIYKIAHWTGVYNGKDQKLNIRNNGRVLYILKGALRMGCSYYKKL